MTEHTYATYAFVSYKGGAGRTSAMVNTSNALAVQGLNVLLVDLDVEAPGLPIFSSVKIPDPFFQPDVLFNIHNPNQSLVQCCDADSAQIPLEGWQSVLDEDGLIVESRLNDLPVYECRSKDHHPLEGRKFALTLGGRFEANPPGKKSTKDVGSIYASTGWSYFPPKGADLASLMAVQQSDQIYSDESGGRHFFDTLVESAVNSVERLTDVRIDYVLLDGHPGLSLRNIFSLMRSDGVVLVGSGSRGNMAGIKDYISKFARNPDGRLPPVLGIIMSPLLSRVWDPEVSVVSQPREALLRHEQQIRLGDAIKELAESVRGELLASNHQYPEFVDLLRESYHETLALSPSKAAESLQESLWGPGWLDETDSTEYYKHVIPIMFEEHTVIYDRVLDLRGFARTGELFKDDKKANIDGICLLAGHLRSQNKDSQNHPRDLAYVAWHLLRTRNNDEVEWSKIKQESVPWRVYWFLALRDERNGRLNEVLEKLTIAKDLQLQQCGALHPDWPGDWRLHLKSARISSRDPDVERSLVLAVNSLKYEKGVLVNDGAKSRLTDRKADIHRQLAAFLDDRGKKDTAGEHYRIAIDEGCVLPELINEAVEFVIKHKSNPSDALPIGFVNAQFEKLLNRHNLRPRLVLPLARLKLAEYWLSHSADPIRVLDGIINGFREWEQFRALGQASADARGAALLGMALIELASLQTENRVLQYHNTLQAVEQFEKATQQELSALPYHLYLAIARLLQYQSSHSPYQSNSRTEFESHEDLAVVKPTELDVRIRDAFYAFEQAVALQLSEIEHTKPTFYFDGKDAETLAGHLPAAIQYLARVYDDRDKSKYIDDRDICQRLGKWFSRMLQPASNSAANIATVTSLLVEAGLTEGSAR